MTMLPSWSQCSKCNSTVENPSSAVQTLLKGFLFVIKCPKCNQLFPSKKYSILMGILVLWCLYIIIVPKKLCKCPCYDTMNIPHTYYDPKTGNYIDTPKFYPFLKDHCK